MPAEEGGRRTLRNLGFGSRGLGGDSCCGTRGHGRGCGCCSSCGDHPRPHRPHSLDRESPGGRESNVGRRVCQGGGTKKRTTGSRRGRRESRGCRAGQCSALRRSWSAKTRNYSFPVCYFPDGGDSSRRTTRRGDQMRRRREERTTRSRRVGGLKAGGCRPRGGAYSPCCRRSKAECGYLVRLAAFQGRGVCICVRTVKI